MNKYLADTTVLIEHLRGNPKAKLFLEGDQPCISSVTRAELIQGSHNKFDLKMVKKVCEDLDEVYFTEKITRLALQLLEKFHLSHGLLFLDTLIAATAIENKLILVTGNVKHFAFIKELKVRGWKDIEAGRNVTL